MRVKNGLNDTFKINWDMIAKETKFKNEIEEMEREIALYN